MGKKKAAAETPQEQQPQQGNGGSRAPIREIRFGRLRLAIWRNEGKDGPWNSITLSRTYRDGEGAYKSASSFGRDDLLVLAELCRAAYLELIAEAGQRPTGHAQPGEQPSSDEIPL